MKLLSSIKISFKLLKNNYKQNLIIGLLFILINLYLSILLSFAVGLKISSTHACQLNYQEYSQYINYDKHLGNIGKEELSEIYSAFEKNNIKLLDLSGSFKMEFDTVYVYDYNYLDLELIVGDSPKNHSNTNYVYLENTYLGVYNINDTFETPIGDFIVGGFSEDIYDYIFDLNYLYSNNYTLTYLNISIDTNNSDYKDAINLLKDFSKLIDKYESFEAMVYSYSLDPVMKIETIFNTIMIVMILFTLLLLLFSILIIGNSIKIAFEKNYKFYSVLLLSGGKKKDVLKITIFEMLMILLVSFIFSSILLLALNSILYALIGKIFDVFCFVFVDGLPTIYVNKVVPIYPIIIEYIVFTIVIILFIVKKLSFIYPESPINMVRRDLE